jgi:hypothetical protein
MHKYAFVVAATHGYIPELCALLNSLDYVQSKADVILIGIQLPKEFVNQFNKLDYKVIYEDVPEAIWGPAGGRSEIVCRKRYWYAAELGAGYEAVCVLDADLVFCRDPVQFFNIAAKTGYILGPTKEQNKVYDDDHHTVKCWPGDPWEEQSATSIEEAFWPWNVERGYYNDKDLCNCPVFLDPFKWRDALRLSWEVFNKGGFRAPDMDAMNLSFLHYWGYDKIVKLPGLQWLGTNEQHLKPYIRVVERHGDIFTENGLEIFSYHGQYYKEKWRRQQLINRHNCAEGYLKATECCDNMAEGAMRLLYDNFMRMLDWKIQIEKKEYTNEC